VAIGPVVPLVPDLLSHDISARLVLDLIITNHSLFFVILTLGLYNGLQGSCTFVKI